MQRFDCLHLRSCFFVALFNTGLRFRTCVKAQHTAQNWFCVRFFRAFIQFEKGRFGPFSFPWKSTGCMTRSWFFLYHSHDSYPKQSNEACPSDSEFCNICNILLYNQHFITDRWKFEKRQQATLNLNGKILKSNLGR